MASIPKYWDFADEDIDAPPQLDRPEMEAHRQRLH
jgi:hypothetical protein